MMRRIFRRGLPYFLYRRCQDCAQDTTAHTRRAQKPHAGGTVEAGTEQKRDAHPQVAGHNGTAGGCLLFPTGGVCGKSTIKEIQVNEAQPEIILPIRNPVPSGSKKRAAQAAALSAHPSITMGLWCPAQSAMTPTGSRRTICTTP